ncbi:MAG: sigma 54-interacting transcriptional regulator [Myxococcota bacterium]
MGGDSTQGDLSHADRWVDDLDGDVEEEVLGLSVAWCLSEPDRVGEVLLVLRGRTVVLGRDAAADRLVRIRPRRRVRTEALQGRLLSRRQLEVRSDGERLSLRNVGSCALLLDGVRRRRHAGAGRRGGARPAALVLVAVRRPPLPDLDLEVPFGRADADGIVGESAAAWQLRARLRAAGRTGAPVLVLGPSGSGKELAARALHAASARAGGPFVARNAATLPEGLVDAELFGHARGYPNAGMPERPGLVGAADGGTLFLDEIGEMPQAVQAHLLRVLDRDGAYQRLGEARERRSRFGFVAATNRDPASLKHDLAARLTVRVEVPGLDARPEDVPLLVRHLLRDARRDPEVAARLFDGDEARVAPALIAALVRQPWPLAVRELASALWLAVQTSPGRALQLTPEVRERLGGGAPVPVEPEDVDADAIRAALAAADGNVTQAARALGLSSRYVLYRLMRRHGV